MRTLTGTIRTWAAVIVGGALLFLIPIDSGMNRGPEQTPGAGETLPAEPVAEQAPRQVGTDRYGDPLPPGAIARLGTVRLSHNSPVHDLAFSPDGKAIASTCSDGCIHLWAVPTGQEIGRLGPRKHVDRGTRDGGFVRFTPDGKNIVAAAGWPREVAELWSLETQTARRLGEDEIALYAVPSPDGKLVAEMTRRGFVRLWDIATGKILWRFSNQRGGIGPPANALAFSPDSRYLAMNNQDYAISVWDVARGEMIRSWVGHKGEVVALAFLPDGKRLLSASWDGTARLWEVETGKELHCYLKAGGRMKALALHPDGKQFACSGEDNLVRLFELDPDRWIRNFPVESHNCAPIAFSPDGALLATGGGDGRIGLWEVATGQEVGPRRGPLSAFGELAFSPDGKCLVAHSWRATTLWDPRTGREIGLPQTGGPRTWGFGLSRDGQTLATYSTPAGGGRHTAIVLRKLPNLRSMREFLIERPDREDAFGFAWTDTLAVGPGGKLVATSGKGATVQLWDVAKGQPIRSLGQPHDNRYLASLGFSPDGKVLVARRNARMHLVIGMNPRSPGEMHFWNVVSGEELPQFKSFKEWCEWVVFAPDGKTLVTNGEGSDYEIRLWDTVTGKERRTFRVSDESPKRIVTAAFSSDGQILAAGCGDGDILLWRAATGEVAGRLKGHTGPITALACSADGLLLASSSSDNTGLIWALPEAVRHPRPRER